MTIVASHVVRFPRRYVNVVLFTEKPVPLLLPYLFHKSHQADNDLREWVFINKSLERSRHRVDPLEDVG